MATYPVYERVAKPLDSSKVGFIIAVEDGLIVRVDIITSDGVTPGGFRVTAQNIPDDTARKAAEAFLAALFKGVMDAHPETEKLR